MTIAREQLFTDRFLKSKAADSTSKKEVDLTTIDFNFWDEVRSPKDGSVLHLLLNNDRTVQDWWVKKGMDEMMSAVISVDASIPVYIITRLVHNHTNALSVAERIVQTNDGIGDFSLVSAITRRDIKKKNDMVTLFRQIIAYHPSVLNKIRNLMKGTKIISHLAG